MTLDDINLPIIGRYIKILQVLDLSSSSWYKLLQNVLQNIPFTEPVQQEYSDDDDEQEQYHSHKESKACIISLTPEDWRVST